MPLRYHLGREGRGCPRRLSNAGEASELVASNSRSIPHWESRPRRFEDGAKGPVLPVERRVLGAGLPGPQTLPPWAIIDGWLQGRGPHLLPDRSDIPPRQRGERLSLSFVPVSQLVAVPCYKIAAV